MFLPGLHAPTNVAALYAGGGLSAYAVNGSDPATVADFAGTLNSGTPYFRVGGSTSSFASMFSFSRASTATYTNSSGNIVSATSGTARTDHYRWNGSSYVRKGILLESAAATNLLTHSNDFDNAAYGNTQLSFTEGQTNTLTGNSDATLFTGTGVTGNLQWFEGMSVATTSTYTFSVFAKAGTANWLRLLATAYTTPADGGVYFNLSTGTVGVQSSGFTGRIEAFSNGWYRCSITFTTGGSDTFGTLAIRIAEGDDDDNWSGGGTSANMLFYGMQFELGSVPTSLVTTSGSTATRAAETNTAAGSNLDASTTAMSFHLAGEENYADLATAGQVELFDWRVDANNRITVTIDTDGAKTGTITLTMVNGGSSASVAATTQLTPGLNKAFNVAWRVTGSEINIALNGTAATATATAIGVPDLSSASAAFEGRGTRSIFRQAAADWTDSGIESAST